MEGRIPDARPYPSLAVDRLSSGPETRSEAIDLRHLQGFFWRRWKLIIATATVVSAVTFIVLLAVTPHYTGTAQVLLDPRKEKIFGAESIVPELKFSIPAT